MGLIVEFTIPADEFPFGRAVSGDPGVKVWLERVIPLSADRIPFFWATDHDFEAFEQHLRNSEIVKHLEAVTRVRNHALYYAEWYPDKEAFLNGLADAGGTIMEGHGDSTWSFTVRFNNHADLTEFHRFYQDEEFPVRIEQVSSMSDEPGQRYNFDITPTQREALLEALETGSFAVPPETELEAIAETNDLSQRDVSQLIEDATETVLRKALLGFSAADLDDVTEEQ